MNSSEFVLAIAAILLIAFLIGWFTHWLLSRLSRTTRNDMDELDRMAQQLHDAEETRDRTITYQQQREAELSRQLNQTEAELRAAMEGLREARREAEELRGYIETLHQGNDHGVG